VVPTWTNFLFCHVGEDVSNLCQLLQEDGIIVRPMSGPWGAPDAFRVTIGTREHNEQFVGALQRARARIPELK
jgi:histidinol-phosphate/aromatic aminotransferase/cobyric acid decarboxylase-like protein